MDFAYNASALGAGGMIERGKVTYTIPSLASVALAPTGGEGRAVLTDYVSQELSFSYAETRVFGKEGRDELGEPSFTTSTYVLMKDVNVFDRIRIGEMGSTVTSTRGFEDDDDHPFSFTVWYRHVTIDKKPIRPKLDVRVASIVRYADLMQLVGGEMAASEADRLAETFNATPKELAALVRQKKPVQGSIVAGIEGDGARLMARTIAVPGLGTVRFGELMLKPGRRRLNLVRITFGRQQVDFAMPNALMMHTEGPEDDFDGGITGGSMTLGSGEGNGIPIGP